MDPVTHALTGALVSRAGFHQRAGRVATIAVVLGAMVPDADMIVGLLGPEFSLRHHRGITHSLVGAPFIAMLLGYLVYRFSSLRSYRLAVLMVFIGILSHIFLDYITSFGTVLFDPVATGRYALNLVFILDPFMTVPLAVCFLLIWKGKLRAPRWAFAALGYLMLYLLFCAFMHGRAEGSMLAYVRARGFDVERHTVFPAPLTPFRWLGVVEGADGYMRVPLGPGGVNEGGVSTVARGPENGLVSSARESDVGRLFHWFARYPVSSFRSEGDFAIVEFHDVRYMLSILDGREPPFVLRMVFDGVGRPVSTELNGRSVSPPDPSD